MSLRESDRARLRDWYDTSGTWVIKMTALYDLVGQISARREVEGITIPLPWQKPPITLNPGLRSSNIHAKNNRVQTAKAEAVIAIRAAKVKPMAGAIVWLHYQAPDYIRRDADNLAGTLKVVQDALVVAGVLLEDSWVTVPASGCRIHPPIKGQPGRLWITLTDPDQETP